MNHTEEALALLSSDAKKDLLLKGKLLATRTAEDPMDAFCKLACEAGQPHNRW